MYKKIFLLISIVYLITSCKSKKDVAVIEDKAASKVVAMHYNNEAQFKTMNSRMRLTYQDTERTQSLTT